MSNQYLGSLDEASRKRYMEKLTFRGNLLPDPLDDAIRVYVFKEKEMRKWPPVQFGDLYMYLVQKECAFTHESFKNYKGLESYNYLLSGKVRHVRTFQNETLKICMVTCEVEASQTLKRVHKLWIVADLNGTVHCGHCTCMAGLGEVCSHVAALLFALEMATREGVQSPSPTSLHCLWNKSSKKVTPLPAAKIQFSHKRKVAPIKNITSKLPPQTAYNEFINVIKKDIPTAAVLTIISKATPFHYEY